MDHYLDIHLLPDPEFPPTVLMSALVSKLHRGLVEDGSGRIGISFPDVADNIRTLGRTLRLHGTGSDLQRLMQRGWTKGIRDHVEIGDPSPIPAHAGQRQVRRIQAKSNPERLRRRLMARKQVDPATAKQLIPDTVAERLDLPYVVLVSATTGQRFKLFIEHLPVQDKAVPGTFGAYGLSPTATVPWF